MYLGTRIFVSSSREITGTAEMSTDGFFAASSAFLWVSSLRLGAIWSLYQTHMAVPTLRMSEIVCFCFDRSPCMASVAPATPGRTMRAARARVANRIRAVMLLLLSTGK